MAKKKPSREVAPTAVADEQKRRDLFIKLRSWFELEHMRQQVNRYQMALDCDYYDGDQWRPDEARALRARGQNPIVFNEVKPTVDWLIGTERRMRRDFKVLARQHKSKEAEADAEVKTQLLKYLADVNRTPFERSRAFDDTVKAGLGWIEVRVTGDPEDGEIIQTRSESWRCMLHDSIQAVHSPDPRDWRYLFRFKEVDLDIAEAYFPKHTEELRRASTMGDWRGPDEDEWTGGWPTLRMSATSTLPMRWITYNPESDILNPRDRVSLVECWYRAPTTESTGAGTSTQDRTRMGMRVAIFTKHDLLLDLPSPYQHNRFPFVPLWCYRRKADGLPYGVVRNIRGPQDDLNKRMSKSQFLLSVNQLQMERSALDKEAMDLEEVRDETAAPDGIAIFADGALSGNKVRSREGMQLAAGHLELADRDIMAIRASSGITGENRGMETNAKSGKAIIAKQEQGSMVTAEVFDNMLLAHQLEGELTLSLIEQWYTEEKTFSVTGDRFKLDYYTINGRDPVSGARINDVTAFKAAFVIGEAPWRQALGEAMFEGAMNMLAQLAPVVPQVVVSIIDLVFEWADIPNKQLVLQRIRSVTGVADPDKGESPEQQAAKQQDQQAKQMALQAQMAQLQADIREAQLRGDKLDAEAMAIRLKALRDAAEAAALVAQVPHVAPIADELARSVGFKDHAGDAVLGAAAPALPAAAAQPPQPAQPAEPSQPVPAAPAMTQGA